MNRLLQAYLTLLQSAHSAMHNSWSVSEPIGATCLLAHKWSSARLHLALLQTWLRMVYRPSPHSRDSLVCLPPLILDSFHWWESPCNVCQRSPLLLSPLTKLVVTDVSLLGWGEHLDLLRVEPHLISTYCNFGSSIMHIIPSGIISDSQWFTYSPTNTTAM